MKKLLGLVVLLVVSGVVLNGMYARGIGGNERDAGTIVGKALPNELIVTREKPIKWYHQHHPKQVFFGDLHVRTILYRRFLWALPIFHGKGVYPIADAYAYAYARYCSAINFWSIADHAEASTPLRWSKTTDSIRQCQSLALDQDNPGLVAFIGFEWTQVGSSPGAHYGHKNVIFKDLHDDAVATGL